MIGGGPFVKFLLGQPGRLLLAVLAVGIGVALLRVSVALDDGLAWLAGIPESRPWLMAAERYRPDRGSRVPLAHVEDLRRMNGVAAAVPETRIELEVRESRRPLVAIAIDLRDLLAIGAVDAHADGTIRNWLDRHGHQRVADGLLTRSPAVIGRRLSRRLGYNKGDHLDLQLPSGRWVLLTIIAIANRGPAEHRGALFIDRTAIAGAAGDPGTCTRLRVLPDEGTDRAELAAAIDRRFARYHPPLHAMSADVWVRMQLEATQGLAWLVRLMAWLAFVTGLGGYAWMLQLTLADRLRDIVALRLIGASALRVARRIALEAAVVGVVAGLVGQLVAWRVLTSWLPVVQLDELPVELPTVPWSSVLVAAIAVAGTIAASVIPAHLAIRNAWRRIATM